MLEKLNIQSSMSHGCCSRQHLIKLFTLIHHHHHTINSHNNVIRSLIINIEIFAYLQIVWGISWCHVWSNCQSWLCWLTPALTLCVTVCGSARDIQCKDGHTANTRPRIGWYSGMSHASHSQDNTSTGQYFALRCLDQWESWDGPTSANDNGVMGLRHTTAIQLLLLLTPSQLSVKHLSPAPCYQLSCLATEILKLSSVPLSLSLSYNTTPTPATATSKTQLGLHSATHCCCLPLPKLEHAPQIEIYIEYIWPKCSMNKDIDLKELCILKNVFTFFPLRIYIYLQFNSSINVL